MLVCGNFQYIVVLSGFHFVDIRIHDHLNHLPRLQGFGRDPEKTFTRTYFCDLQVVALVEDDHDGPSYRSILFFEAIDRIIGESAEVQFSRPRFHNGTNISGNKNREVR